MYWVTQGQLPPTLETVKFTTGDPSRQEAFSVPSRDPREVVAWLRAAVDDRVSPEKEQRVSAQGRRPRPPHSILCCCLCWGRREGPGCLHQESDS